jgi:putative nucleotidyltransferase with HDIG domain
VRYLDAIKRWRLAQQGLSSGRKRRIHTGNPLLQILQQSFWIRWSLFVAFALISAVMVYNAAPASAFANTPGMGALYGAVIAFAAVVMFQVSLQTACNCNSRVLLVFGGLICHLLVVRLVIGLASSGLIPREIHLFVIPFALAPMLHGILLGRSVGAFSAVFVTLIGCLFAPQSEALAYMILSLVAGITSVLLANRVRKRAQLMQIGLNVGAVTLGLGLLLGRLDIASCFGPDPIGHAQILGIGVATAIGTALFTAMLINGLLPLLESLFALTTDISWLELSDLNHKLLRQMQLEAPGTFHHSLVVAALAEAAAEKIGANAPLSRVCSYFHDVGKLAKPSYFIENQHEGTENPHDSLTPTMSALIIIAHVKDGVDMAVKHKLNPRIIDVIKEHHAGSIVSYFYHKAHNQKKLELEKIGRKIENPEDFSAIDEKNFRYPGDRPTTRESGIICIADSVESASRTLVKPTPARIRTLIDDIVRAKIDDKQLDQCPLTFKEIVAIKESFASTLRSMLHSRIDYPKADDTPSAAANRAEPDRESARISRTVPEPRRHKTSRTRDSFS